MKQKRKIKKGAAVNATKIKNKTDQKRSTSNNHHDDDDTNGQSSHDTKKVHVHWLFLVTVLLVVLTSSNLLWGSDKIATLFLPWLFHTNAAKDESVVVGGGNENGIDSMAEKIATDAKTELQESTSSSSSSEICTDDNQQEQCNAKADMTLESSSSPTTNSSNDQCKLYLAKSTIPNSGLGVFTTEPLKKQTFIDSTDVAIQFSDIPPHRARDLHVFLFEYAWDGQLTGGQYEGMQVFSAVPGLGMLANGHPTKSNVKFWGKASLLTTNTNKSPLQELDEGANSPYNNYTFSTIRDIPAGGEFLITYGKEWFEERQRKGFLPPSPPPSQKDNIYDDGNELEMKHSLEWLQTNGLCLDNIRVGSSTIPQAGRGAFTTRFIPKDSLVAPAPMLQLGTEKSHEIIRVKSSSNQQGQRGGGNRGSSGGKDGEEEEMEYFQQQILNYSYGHQDSSILLFPYSPIVNYINHNSTRANVILRWSNSTQINLQPHHFHLQDLVKRNHAGLMLEFIALRDLQPNEEILLNYGIEWEEAWKEYQQKKDKVRNHSDDDTVYQNADELNHNDRLESVRTEEEQRMNPYAENIFTSCFYKYDLTTTSRGSSDTMTTTIWKGTPNVLQFKYLRPCQILKRDILKRRKTNNDGTEEEEEYYTVNIRNRYGLMEDERIPRGSQPHIVTRVPRIAIRFSSKLYTTDQHSKDAFRHKIHMDDDVFPQEWKDLVFFKKQKGVEEEF